MFALHLTLPGFLPRFLSFTSPVASHLFLGLLQVHHQQIFSSEFRLLGTISKEWQKLKRVNDSFIQNWISHVKIIKIFILSYFFFAAGFLFYFFASRTSIKVEQTWRGRKCKLRKKNKNFFKIPAPELGPELIRRQLEWWRSFLINEKIRNIPPPLHLNPVWKMNYSYEMVAVKLWHLWIKKTGF